MLFFLHLHHSSFWNQPIRIFSLNPLCLHLAVGFRSARWFSADSNAGRKKVPGLPIGYDNFADVIENNLTFVDKSLFIKDLIDNVADKVTLITRPRRFGKSLNLSMLHYFFAAEVHGQSTKHLFERKKKNGLKITEQSRYMEHQGKYPVIALSFKDIKAGNFSSAYKDLVNLIAKGYQEHSYLLTSPRLSFAEKETFSALLKNDASEEKVKTSLLDLTDYLFRHHGEKTLLLIDEYDTPILSGHLNGYYKEIVDVIRDLLGSALKSNDYLNRAVLTGILRISKESLFSGLNNVQVYSILDPMYGQYFGFTEDEVKAVVEKSGLTVKLEEIREWYNGYQIGNQTGTTVVYNPWSIANCLNKKGFLQPYWVNTSDNVLVKDLIKASDVQFKRSFEVLLEGGMCELPIDENIPFSQLTKNGAAVWSLLLMTGYLTIHVPSNQSTQKSAKTNSCVLRIPNLEIRSLFRNIIEEWLSNGHGILWYERFISHLLEGKVNEFKESLKEIMLQVASYHDMAREPEAFYQGLMIGLTACLNTNDYEKKSNIESGYGRYDILIICKDLSKLSILLELKSVHPLKKTESELDLRLEKEAKVALHDIDSLEYNAELKQRGIRNVLKMGIAFCGKKFAVEARQERH